MALTVGERVVALELERGPAPAPDDRAKAVADAERRIGGSRPRHR